MTKYYSWEEISEQLSADIQVFYTKNDETNRKREYAKKRTIKWIIDRMKKGPQLGGTRLDLPEFTLTFGELWPVIRRAMALKYPKCYLCGKAPTEEIHHIRPRQYGGKNDPCNLMALCKKCHDEVHRRIEAGVDEAISRALREAMPIDTVWKRLDSYIKQEE